MKKLFSLLSLGLALTFGFQAQAQYCGSSMVTTAGCGVPPSNPNFHGFGPLDSIPCIVQGANTALVLPFVNYSTFSAQGNTVHIYKLRIDTISNLPCGLCWSTNSPTNEFYANQFGCFQLQGVTNDQVGEYKAHLILSVETTSDTTGYSGPTAHVNANLGDVYLYFRVVAAGNVCAGVDTNQLGNTASCTTGISEVNNNIKALTIQPNPMSGEAKVAFTSEISGEQSIKIMNMVGSEVYGATINTKIGMNETTISKGNLPAGIYILSVGSAQGIATRKFVISE
jgi:hypothetical protein